MNRMHRPRKRPAPVAPIPGPPRGGFVTTA